MTGAMVVVSSGKPQQPLVAMLIQVSFLLLVLKLAPYEDNIEDWSSFICSLALTLTTLFGFMLMVNTQDGDVVLPVESIETFLMAINLLCFAYQSGAIAWVAYRDIKRANLIKQQLKQNEIIPTKKVSSKTQVLPVTCCTITKDELSARAKKAWKN